MIKLLIVVLLLLGAIWLSWILHQDPGDVLITFHGWQIETSVWAAALLVLLVFIVGYGVLRLVIRGMQWPQQWRRWRQASRQRHAQRFTELAVCKMIEESWLAAEEHFHKAASAIEHPLLCYIGLAIAAQNQHAHSKRDQYLRQAYEAAPEAELTLGILQAKLQIQSGQFTEAAASLAKLKLAIPQHPEVKRLSALVQTLS